MIFKAILRLVINFPTCIYVKIIGITCIIYSVLLNKLKMNI